jgi:hypothetical protein
MKLKYIPFFALLTVFARSNAMVMLDHDFDLDDPAIQIVSGGLIGGAAGLAVSMVTCNAMLYALGQMSPVGFQDCAGVFTIMGGLHGAGDAYSTLGSEPQRVNKNNPPSNIKFRMKMPSPPLRPTRYDS